MIPPAGMAIAALTVMLWILWSDSLRTRRPTPILYLLRILTYLVMAALLILNRYRYPWRFTTGSTVLVALAAVVGVGGAVYFAVRLVRRA